MPENDLRFPIGTFVKPDKITKQDCGYAIGVLSEMPELLRAAVRNLDATQLSTPYRDGGWTLRQVVHHLADSHMTAFHRVRKALTEDFPVVMGYDEAAFAKLPDLVAPVEWSLEIVEAVHARWVMLLQSLAPEDWQRGIKHSERGPMTIEELTLSYAWHSQHHVAHINGLRLRQGW